MISLKRTIPKGIKAQQFTMADILEKMNCTGASSRVPGVKQLQDREYVIYRRAFNDCEILFYLSGYVVYKEKGEKKRTSVFYLPDISYYLYENGIIISSEDWGNVPFLVAAIMIGTRRVEENIISGAANRQAIFDESFTINNLRDERVRERDIDLASLLAEARNVLKPNERLIFDNLCEFQDITITDRAKMLGIPRTTLISRINSIGGKISYLRDDLYDS